MGPRLRGNDWFSEAESHAETQNLPALRGGGVVATGLRAEPDAACPIPRPASPGEAWFWRYVRSA